MAKRAEIRVMTDKELEAYFNRIYDDRIDRAFAGLTPKFRRQRVRKPALRDLKNET